jgi:hypothetical protein
MNRSVDGIDWFTGFVVKVVSAPLAPISIFGRVAGGGGGHEENVPLFVLLRWVAIGNNAIK